MRINSITVRDFKRFKDLRVQNIPASAKLVVIAGPNGSGKSSLFDAMLSYQRTYTGFGLAYDPLYFLRSATITSQFSPRNNVGVNFHEGNPENQEDWRRAFYVRSAYRNDPDFTLNAISAQSRIIDQVRMNRLADNDATVSQNYASLTSRALHGLFSIADDSPETAVSFRNRFIGNINTALVQVFDDLTLTSLGIPGESGAFFFSKGQMVNFHYKNLSGGEKAAFDLIVDIIAKKAVFNNTVYCIDEPEAHMNSRAQRRLVRALYDLIPENSQLWIATHAIGMIREARDIYNSGSGSVSFLDFGERDFDNPQVIEPVAPTSAFWRSALDIALDDLVIAHPTCAAVAGADAVASTLRRSLRTDRRRTLAVLTTERKAA